jgi:DNA mismatch repair ATPase MutL
VGRFVVSARAQTAFYSVRVLATKACHSAVKLGDTLSHEEMKALIEEWLTSRYPVKCPHGRSICYRLDHKDTFTPGLKTAGGGAPQLAR